MPKSDSGVNTIDFWVVELKELLSEYVYERKQGDTDEITYAEYKNKYSYGNAGDYRQGARGCQRQRC